MEGSGGDGERSAGGTSQKASAGYLIVMERLGEDPERFISSNWNIPKLFVLRNRKKTPAEIQAD